MPNRYDILFPHPAEPSVFLIPTDGGWSLPRDEVDPGETEHWAELSDLTGLIGERWGVDCTFLRCIHREENPESKEDRRVQIMEIQGSPNALTPRGRWVRHEDLDSLAFTTPEQREWIETWLAEVESGVFPALRSPWAIPGWYAGTTDWIESRLRENGVQGSVTMEQVKSWSISCVLKVTADGQEFYIKASHDMFAQEARLTHRLSELYPDHLPDVLASDGDRNRFLMRAFQGRFLGEIGIVETWEEAVRAFARIQVDQIGRVDELRRWGCPYRSLSSLRDGLARLLREPELLLVGNPVGITDEEYAEMRGLAPAITDALSALEGCGIPSSLVHGDLHPYNITMRDGAPLFFDWSDGAVAHPFIDFLLIEERMGNCADAVKAAVPRLRAAYLEPWAALFPRDTLETASDLAQKVAPIYHILTYRWIVDHTERSGQWELVRGMKHYAHVLLDRWKE